MQFLSAVPDLKNGILEKEILTFEISVVYHVLRKVSLSPDSQQLTVSWILDLIARLPLELTERTVTENRLNLNRPNRYDPQDKILISVVKCHVQV